MLELSNIWNYCDETGITTVQVPPKILAPKGKKQIGGMTSGERRINVTMIAAVSASGNSVPPLFVSPHVNFKPFMLNGAPPGSVGAANPSGWYNETIFMQFLQLFIQHVHPSAEKPVLILLDNHKNHISLSVIDLAKSSDVVLLTFHPHTSHRVQPLDREVFGPFKTYHNEAVNNWMLSPGNAGKPVTIYDIAALAGQTYPRAFVPTNIMKGFKVTGFVPFNENIFPGTEFMAVSVTYRHMSHENISQTCAPVTDAEPSTGKEDDSSNLAPKRLPLVSTIVSPEMIRLHPKAQPRKTANRG